MPDPVARLNAVLEGRYAIERALVAQAGGPRVIPIGMIGRRG